MAFTMPQSTAPFQKRPKVSPVSFNIMASKSIADRPCTDYAGSQDLSALSWLISPIVTTSSVLNDINAAFVITRLFNSSDDILWR